VSSELQTNKKSEKPQMPPDGTYENLKVDRIHSKVMNDKPVIGGYFPGFGVDIIFIGLDPNIATDVQIDIYKKILYVVMRAKDHVTIKIENGVITHASN
jgi:hypothetical protein